MKNQKGFTLIELLVVIAILGILAAIIVPSVTNYISSGNMAAANAELNQVENATAAYMADNKLSVLPTPLSIQPPSATPIATFISGTLNGSYNVDVDGVVTGGRYPADTNLPESLKWDDATRQWVKK